MPAAKIIAPLRVEPSADSRLLQQAKDWHSKQVASATPGALDIKTYTPGWDKAKVVKNSEGQNVIGVPMFRSKQEYYIELNVLAEHGKSYRIIKQYGLDRDKKDALNIYSGQGELITKGYYDREGGLFIAGDYFGLRLMKEKEKEPKTKPVEEDEPGVPGDGGGGGGGSIGFSVEGPEVVISGTRIKPDPFNGSNRGTRFPSYPIGGDQPFYSEFPRGNRGGGGRGRSTAPTPADPNNPENDLPLPCENVPDPNFDDIHVKNTIAQEGVKNMLPYQYHAYIKFDEKGKLDNTLLQSAANNPNLPASNIYNCLVYLSRHDVDITVGLKTAWIGITTQHPDGKSYKWSNETQDMEGITVIPGAIPLLPGVPVTRDPNKGAVFIKKGTESSMGRLAFITAHELLGHMYQYLKSLPYIEGDRKFERWVSSKRLRQERTGK